MVLVDVIVVVVHVDVIVDAVVTVFSLVIVVVTVVFVIIISISVVSFETMTRQNIRLQAEQQMKKEFGNFFYFCERKKALLHKLKKKIITPPK